MIKSYQLLMSKKLYAMKSYADKWILSLAYILITEVEMKSFTYKQFIACMVNCSILEARHIIHRLF